MRVMRFKGALFLLAGLLLGVALGALVLMSGPSRAGTRERQLPITVGSVAPDFSLAQLGGKPLKLSDLKGKPVVVNFWATWCPPCKEEMPLLQRYSSQFGEQMILLGVDYAEQEPVVQDFVDQMGITFPILLDSDGAVSNLYYVRNYPTTFFIDAEGVVRAQHLGLLTEDSLQKYLKTIGLEP